MWDNLIERDGVSVLMDEVCWRPIKWDFTDRKLDVLFVDEFNDDVEPRPLKRLTCNPIYFSIMDSWYEPKVDKEKFHNFENGPDIDAALEACKQENRDIHLFRFKHYDYAIRAACYGEPKISDVEVD